MAVDSLWSSVASVINYDGFGGPFLDYAGLNWAAVGAVSVDSGVAWAGGLSASFQGGYLYAVNPVFAAGSGDVCFEAWVYPTSLNNVYQIIFDSRDPSGANGLLVWLGQNGSLRAWAGGSSGDAYTAAGSVPLNQWSHVTGKISSGVLSVALNGVFSTNVSNRGNLSSGRAFIGQTQEGGNYFYGRMGGHRLTLAARYTGNFQPAIGRFPLGPYVFSGSVKDAAGSPAIRRILAYRRDTGVLVGTTASAADGTYAMPVTYAGLSDLVCQDTTGTLPDLVLTRMTPG